MGTLLWRKTHILFGRAAIMKFCKSIRLVRRYVERAYTLDRCRANLARCANPTKWLGGCRVLTNKKLWRPTRGDCLINDGNKSRDAFPRRAEGVCAFAASFMDARPGKFLPYSIRRAAIHATPPRIRPEIIIHDYD